MRDCLVSAMAMTAANVQRDTRMRWMWEKTLDHVVNKLADLAKLKQFCVPKSCMPATWHLDIFQRGNLFIGKNKSICG